MSVTSSANRMTTFVVGADGSRGGWGPLAWAEAEMENRCTSGENARMVVCRTVLTDQSAPAPGRFRLELTDPDFVSHLEQIRERHVRSDVVIDVCPPNPSMDLIRRSSRDSVIVLPAPSAQSSVVDATTVAAHAQGVVVAVRPTTPPAGVTAGPFAAHVLVGVDGGPSSRQAIEFAFDYADRHHLPLAAIRAADPNPSGVWVDGDETEVHFTTYAFGLDLLDAELADGRRRHPDVPVRRFVLREPARSALVSASAGAYLLVVGDRGRTALARRFLGSVSRHVIQHAHCTVAVVQAES